METLEWALESVAYDWTNEVTGVLVEMKKMLSEAPRKAMPQELRSAVAREVDQIYNGLVKDGWSQSKAAHGLWH